MTSPQELQAEISKLLFDSDATVGDITSLEDDVFDLVTHQKKAAVDELILLAEGHYWDSLANDAPIIRVHLHSLRDMMFPNKP